jgi:hypothetical protein
MREKLDQTYRQIGLGPWQQVLAFSLACAIIVSRRPDALFHPQFWAEDGVVWFAQAYNDGWWQSLFRTQVGYFQTLPRLVSALALLVPLSLAPLLCNLVALAVQAIPVSLLLSARSCEWGNLRTRAALAAIYLALPNSPEICAIITNAQWALAFAAFLVLVETPPPNQLVRAGDISIVVLCGLTGPFCIFLLAIAIFIAWKRRNRELWMHVGILVVCSVIQAYGLFLKSPGERSSGGLGATPALFIRMLSGDIYLGALFGPNGLAMLQGSLAFLVLLFIAAGGTTLIAVVLRRAPFQMTHLAMFAIMVLGATLISPSSEDPLGIPKWQLIAAAGAVRYWYYPSLVFLWSLVMGLNQASRRLKGICAFLLVLLCFGVALRWRRPAFQDTHFASSAKSFETAPAGTIKVFPENPEGWSFRLVKRADY